ncbi:hypothetical protein DFR49_0727 [Hephaestia caeni]|uniref:DUF5983 domain-containing protein n=1 Tax=Hephaestia caeni TaxID=645617 RepID=A0A397PJ69_9SPHN|nr:hypothetical protein [Hephaestia caeni]RIA46194.1 hypothetical protein DFR49_0727 [Hephaestia caeni]
MTSQSISIAPVPLNERCAQNGATFDFDRIGAVECAIHRAALDAKFGYPPPGIKMEAVKTISTLGTFYNLMVHFDDAAPVATAYARRIELEPLSYWQDAGFTPPFVYDELGILVSCVHPTVASAVRAAVATLGQFPESEEFAAMRANLLTAYPHARAPTAMHPRVGDMDTDLLTRSAHLALLSRARKAIETPGELDDDVRNTLIDDIDAATTRLATCPLPWPLMVHVGSIEHEEGVNHYIAVTDQALTRQIADYCREFWFEIDDACDPSHLDDETVVREYFRQHPNEVHSTDVEHLAPEPAIAPGLLGTDKVLLLDNRHISSETDSHLLEWANIGRMEAPLFVTDTPVGWLLSDEPGCPFEELPDDLERAMTCARVAGAQHLLIGRDGMIVEGLQRYD